MNLDDLSAFCGSVGTFVILAVIKGTVQVIRLIINFIKWLIKRKDDKQ